ncbi:UNVERIFIED_CONTAM: hypothetical protein GTU68_023095 [Idotea baltica]|nr:hypothetical protein [Idotea baltica]
MQDIGQFLML